MVPTDLLPADATTRWPNNRIVRSHSFEQATNSALLVLGYFLGKQREQHLVPILVPPRIALALGDEPPIMFDVCVVDEAVHFDLQRQAGGAGIDTIVRFDEAVHFDLQRQTGGAGIDTSVRFQTQRKAFYWEGRLNVGQPHCPIKGDAAGLAWLSPNSFPVDLLMKCNRAQAGQGTAS
jgi:hypothetical protein